MELLTHNFSSRFGRWIAIALLGSAVAGCALITSLSQSGKPFGFNHKVHAKEGLECADCHTTWESADSPGMPVLQGCVLCHEAIDQEKPPERQVTSLFVGDEYKGQHVARLKDEVIFSHLKHASKPIECKACHKGIDENEYVDHSLAVGMTDCTTCHQQEKVAASCSTCHQRLREDVAPDSHLFQWKKMHGPTMRSHDTATVNNCSLCHEDSTCKTCHQAESPDNHNNFFRQRGHGLIARMDRQNCTACHRPDSCESCHQDTRPITHSGTFGGTQSNHCVGCHLPVQNVECFTCHKGTPSHETAPARPPGHAAGMNCRQCHGIGQPLPHADNGTECVMCHR
jgi:hypothetical protein